MFNSVIFLGVLLVGFDLTNGAIFSISRGRSEYNIHYLNKKSWTEAKSTCERQTFGQLVSLETADENMWLKIMVVGLGLDFVWTSGIYDASGVWKWSSTNNVMSATRWGPGQPSTTSPDYSVSLFADITTTNWHMKPKTTPLGFICEIPLDRPVPCYKRNDLVIVLDSSGSIGSPNFVTALNFVAKLASAFGRPSRIGFITYSDVAKSVFSLTNGLTPSQIQSRITSEEGAYVGGSTQTDAGINMAISQFASTPSGIPKKMVILTDGQSNTQPLTISSANRAKALGIQGFSVGIGQFDITNPELLASAGGVNNHVFTAKTFDSLIELIRPLSLTVCG